MPFGAGHGGTSGGAQMGRRDGRACQAIGVDSTEHGVLINGGAASGAGPGGPSWWFGPAKRSLPRPGGGRPRLRWTRAFDWAVSRWEPFQGPWVSVELSTCS